MARLTITLSDERHRALKDAALRRHTTIGQIIEESLERTGVGETAGLRVLEDARANASITMSGMTDDEITEWAVDQVDAYRHERLA
jgi:hypothetical protein